MCRIEWRGKGHSKREGGDNLRGGSFQLNNRINIGSWCKAELGKTRLWA